MWETIKKSIPLTGNCPNFVINGRGTVCSPRTTAHSIQFPAAEFHGTLNHSWNNKRKKFKVLYRHIKMSSCDLNLKASLTCTRYNACVRRPSVGSFVNFVEAF